MLPIIAPPHRPGYHAEAPKDASYSLVPLLLLWIGLACAVVDVVSPGSLAFLRWESLDQHLFILGLALPCFLSRRPIAQPIASVLVAFSVLAFYLDYLRQGQLS